MNMFNILDLQYRGSFLVDVPRTIFAWIDGGIYWFIARLYELIVDLAYIRVFSNETLSEFYTRVYGLLSIVMLFKVTFSVISYILDPSKMSDKQQGFGKTITNILVMFVILISCPVAFEMLYDAQEAILSDDVIPRFIFGDDGTASLDEEKTILVGNAEYCAKWSKYITSFDFDEGDELAPWTTSSTGDYISMMVFRSFYGLGDPSDAEKNGTELEGGKAGYTAANWCVLKDENNMNVAIQNASVGKMLEYVNNYHAASNTTKDFYIMEYRFFLSTAVGVYVALMFLSLAFDIAVRSIQLSFLQLIAPIPIISYIDPASSKNGTFSKWIKNVGKTWASLFIRLFSIFFAVYVITEIDTDMIENSFAETGRSPDSFEWILMLFIIIGALMFAKKLPELIEELIPGMKMGKVQLNPLKKISDEAIGGKQIVEAGQRAVRGVGGTAIGIGMGAMSGRGVGHALWSGVRSGASGFFGNRKLADIRSRQADYNRKMRKADNEGSTLGGRITSAVDNFLGVESEAERIQRLEAEHDKEIQKQKEKMKINKVRIEDTSKIEDNIKNLKEMADEYVKKNNEDYLKIEAELKGLEGALANGSGTVSAEDVAKKKIELNDKLKAESKKYLDDAMNNRVESSAKFKRELADYNSNIKIYGKGVADANGAVYEYKAQETAQGILDQLKQLGDDIADAKRENTPYEFKVTGEERAKENLQPQKKVAQANDEYAPKVTGSGK